MRIKRTLSVGTALAVSCLATVVATNATAANPAPVHSQQHEHGMGLDLAALRAHKAPKSPVKHGALQAPRTRSGDVPSSFDLSTYALSPGDQGRVGSCVTWATGYSGYGILMKEQGISGSPMAPMFIYSQIAQGNDQGTWASVALPMEQKQGIDTKDDYWQGDFDYTTQPDDNERANAAHYTLSGWTQLPTSGSKAKAAIQDAISQGMPVPIGFTVHKSFMDMDAETASSYSYLPGKSNSDPVEGGHEVTIVGYNDKGVKIENSWGGNWGDGGFFTVPWSFFDTGDVDEVSAMGKLVKS
ncbi:C1 family peptidase [Streptomyces sp. TM32]|uniref:C1 family peptidase n=1 Tax=Streptomyces sp. TM32 TaxID=1652669 RepID=UPI0020B135CC|nr:C1 family peptidase [Streptomyces sp. TM32]